MVINNGRPNNKSFINITPLDSKVTIMKYVVRTKSTVNFNAGTCRKPITASLTYSRVVS